MEPRRWLELKLGPQLMKLEAHVGEREPLVFDFPWSEDDGFDPDEFTSMAFAWLSQALQERGLELADIEDGVLITNNGTLSQVEVQDLARALREALDVDVHLAPEEEQVQP